MESNRTAAIPNATWGNDTEYDYGEGVTMSTTYTLRDHDSDLRLGFYTKTDDYLVPTAYGMIAVIGLILNVLAIGVLATGKRTSRDIKIQLINLAVANVISSLIYPAYEVVSQLEYSFPGSLPFCKVVRFFGLGALYTSLLWNTAIAIERFFIVYFPLGAVKYTRRIKIIVALIVWFFGFLPQLESLIYGKMFEYDGIYICSINPPLREHHHLLYEWLITAKYILPAIVIAGMYLMIAVKLLKSKLEGSKEKTSTEPSKKTAKRNQVLAMLAVDAIVTLVTWLPYHVAYSVTEHILSETVIYTDRQLFDLDKALIGILLANCFTTPVIYYIFNSFFRKDTHSLVLRICLRKTSQKQKHQLSSTDSMYSETHVSEVEPGNIDMETDIDFGKSTISTEVNESRYYVQTSKGLERPNIQIESNASTKF